METNIPDEFALEPVLLLDARFPVLEPIVLL